MVATEERKIAARNAAVKEEVSKRGPAQAKGKAEDHTKAEETERLNQERQLEK